MIKINNKIFTIEALLGLIKFFGIACPMYILSLFLKKQNKYQNIWLIAERNDQARDNGFHLFQYIKTHTEKENCFYLLDKNSSDKHRFLSLEDIIYFGSYKHYLFYFMSTRHISAFKQGYGCMPNIYACRLIETLVPIKAKRVYLKHGITYNYLEALKKSKSKLDLVICGALPEFNFIKKNFGYKSEEVEYLGLARFDALIHSKTNEKKIMYMPTWRRWLKKADKKTFVNSEYYSKIQSLINNEELKFLLKENKIELILCLHPSCEKFADLFINYDKNIKIGNTDEKDIQTFLKESSLLITDYSSVFFDFAYMEKPLIYYQFDAALFKKKHYAEGYFNYKRDGFGAVVGTEKELIGEIESIIKNRMVIRNKYMDRISRFFPLKDSKNCERNYNSIKNI